MLQNKLISVTIFILFFSFVTLNTVLDDNKQVVEEEALRILDEETISALCDYYRSYADECWHNKVILRDKWYELQRIGDKPLLMASLFGHLNVVSRLLESGIPVNDTTYFGTSALLYAIIERHVTIIQLLLAYGADAYAANQYGETPFFYKGNDPAMIELFQMYGFTDLK